MRGGTGLPGSEYTDIREWGVKADSTRGLTCLSDGRVPQMSSLLVIVLKHLVQPRHHLVGREAFQVAVVFSCSSIPPTASSKTCPIIRVSAS